MKKAFTMIELIFVIIIIGIVSSVSYGSFQRDELAEATHQVLEHIRYTQHLALTENKFDPMEQKYASQLGRSDTKKGLYAFAKWQIAFYNQPGDPNILGYAVYSDRDRGGNVDITSHIEPSVDPLERLLIYANVNSKNSTKTNLYTTYNINNISTTCIAPDGDSTTIQGKIILIAFDSMGRPYAGLKTGITDLFKNKIQNECSIKLTHTSGRSATINIKPESGYAFIN